MVLAVDLAVVVVDGHKLLLVVLGHQDKDLLVVMLHMVVRKLVLVVVVHPLLELLQLQVPVVALPMAEQDNRGIIA
jgi:hypothetical protein